MCNNENVYLEKVFFLTKHTMFTLFPLKHYTTKTDIIQYYLLPNSATLELSDQKKIALKMLLFGTATYSNFWSQSSRL